jgi:hypothetical protein
MEIVGKIFKSSTVMLNRSLETLEKISGKIGHKSSAAMPNINLAILEKILGKSDLINHKSSSPGK